MKQEKLGITRWMARGMQVHLGIDYPSVEPHEEKVLRPFRTGHQPFPLPNPGKRQGAGIAPAFEERCPTPLNRNCLTGVAYQRPHQLTPVI